MPIIRTGSTPGNVFDIADASETSFGSFVGSGTTFYRYTADDGAFVALSGSDMNTVGAEPIGGTVEPFGAGGSPFSIGFNGTGQGLSDPFLSVTGLQVPLTELVDLSLSDEAFANNFWSTALGSADLFELDVAYIREMAGDGRGISSGETGIGANDRFILSGTGDGFVDISGDFEDLDNNGGTTLIGGDDEIVAASGLSGMSEIFGETEFGSGTIVGGDDRIDISAAAESIIVLGDTYSIGGAAGGTLIGGDDTLIGSEFSDALYGDTDFVDVTGTLIGGDDTIFGGDGGDSIIGDAGVLNGTVIGGDDTLYGEGGNDTITGNGGSDYIDGGAGVDTAVLSDVDLTGAMVIAAASNPNLRYIPQAVSGDVDTFVSIENFDYGGGSPAYNAFDALTYAATYGDLASAFSGSVAQIEAAAAQHFAFEGYFEGRLGDGTVVFEASEYRANYSDLAGLSDIDATLHYLNFGVYEGRLGFDGFAYLASHTDLLAAFGADEQAAVTHYQNAGRFEGRGVTFDASQYLVNYPDLAAAFGSNVGAATAHFVQFGASEGRTAIDGLDYLASNPDLIEVYSDYGNTGGTDLNAAGVIHYQSGGRNEPGREIDFDAVQYLANYQDLREAFGTSQDAAAEHFIEFGYYEGRTDLDVFA